MAKNSKNRKENNYLLQVVLGAIALGIIFLVGNYVDSDILNGILNELDPYQTVEINSNVDTNNTVSNVSGKLVVDYIDVGQGDSILIRQGEYTMLIDGGTSECKDDLLNFLQQENVDRFEYVIGTHPHEDHIGSLDDVVSAYDFDTFLFPKATATTRTFENLVLAVQAKGKKFTTPKPGEVYQLGEATITVLAPNSERYGSYNDYSIVVKVTYGNTSFMFTGDAETLSEGEILEKGFDLRADVLKIGHHGSTTSTSKKFLEAVNPKYAVISVGRDNTYKHPTKTTMDKLQRNNIPVYRTDESGTVEAVSDGTTITFNVEPGTYSYVGN